MWPALWAGFLRIVGKAGIEVMIALGISVATFTGIDATLTWLKSDAIASMMQLPPQIIGILGLLQVGRCVSLLVSAYLGKLALSGLKNGVMKRWAK